MTKQELSMKLGISQPTVATILKELTAAGLVEEGNVLDSTGGRKAQTHSPVKDARYSVGVDVTEDFLRMVVINLGNEIIAMDAKQHKFAYSDDDWKRVSSEVYAFIKENNIPADRLLDLGITIEAPMREGEIVVENEAYAHIDLKKAATFFDYPVKFRNNAKMAAMSQVWGGMRKDTFVFIRLDNTIRGAMMYNGMPIDFGKINCEFGQLHSVNMGENVLNSVLGRRALLDKSNSTSVHTFIQRVEDGDELCQKLLDEYILEFSMFLYDMHCVFGWEIVIGGSMAKLVDKYHDRFDKTIRDYYYLAKPENEIFSITEFKEMDAAVGAALLPIDRFLSES